MAEINKGKHLILRLIRIMVAANFIFPIFVLAQQGVLRIYVSDTQNRPMTGVVVAPMGAGGQSDPTTTDGRTRLAFSQVVRPNQWASLAVVKPSDLVLISPWDGRVWILPFDPAAPDLFQLLVVVRRGDRHLLEAGLGLKAITSSILAGINEKHFESETEKMRWREQVLKEQAERYGLKPEEVDRAIRAWSIETKDPFEKGVAALYAQQYPEATVELEKSLEQRKTLLDKTKTDVVDAAYFLGQSLYEQGKYREAAQRYNEALALRPKDDKIMNAYGIALLDAADYTQAGLILEDALSIREERLPADHPDVAQSLNNLAELYKAQGRYAAAEPLYKRSFAIMEKALGPNHPAVATALNNLAVLYKVQGRYAAAEPLYKRSLAIREKALGPNHPAVAKALEVLSNLYMKMGRVEEAKILSERAKEIQKKR